MKEFTKKQIISVIMETSSDVGEMAVRPKGVQAARRDPKTGKLIVKQAIPGFKEDNPTLPGEEGIPDYWIMNINKVEGEEILAVPLDCDDYDTFIEQNKQWLEQLGILHKLEPQLIKCTRGKYHRPVLDYYGKKYQHSGEKYGIEENIQRKINPILDTMIDFKGSNGGSELASTLESISMPVIVTSDEKYLDTHSDEFSNERIFLRSKNFDAYESANDFLLSVVDKIYGGEGSSKKSYHGKRQFNLIYRNWEAERRQDKTYQGKTDIYNLDRRGYEEMNLDIALESTFTLEGVKLNDTTFRWSIQLRNRFGRKRPDEYRLKQGLKSISIKDGGIFDDQPLKVSKTVQLDPTKEYSDGNNTIMDDIAVKQGLIETIADFKSMIENIKNADPEVALSIANYSQADVEANESITKSKLQEIINEMAKKK